MTPTYYSFMDVSTGDLYETLGTSDFYKGVGVMASRCIAGDIETAKRMTEEMSADALRVLAVSYKEIDVVPENPTPEELETALYSWAWWA